MIVLFILFKLGIKKTKKVSLPILLPESVVALESPSPSNSTNSELAATQWSIDSPQEQVVKSELCMSTANLTCSMLLEECMDMVSLAHHPFTATQGRVWCNMNIVSVQHAL